MLPEQCRSLFRVDGEPQRLSEIGLQRQGQRKKRHGGIRHLPFRFEVGRRSLGQQIEQPLRHILIQSGQHRQDLVLPILLDQFRQGVERRVGVPMVMAPGVDQMDQIPRQRVRSVPVLHASIMPEAPSCRKTYGSYSAIASSRSFSDIQQSAMIGGKRPL